MPKFDLAFDPPLMNAAGSLGFAPDRRGPIALEQLGAFVTNPVSLRPRTPAQGARLLPFPGGFLLHSGHPNPGFNRVVRRCAGEASTTGRGARRRFRSKSAPTTG